MDVKFHRAVGQRNGIHLAALGWIELADLDTSVLADVDRRRVRQLKSPERAHPGDGEGVVRQDKLATDGFVFAALFVAYGALHAS
ncbi:MAG: hypothetical protein M3N19_09020 [Candidatus Eremiobacteraeota bacterium]|nr:hypothetical protein [Candidatus Eremiobacteraeota bacterium]